jgi:hypothetical protein
MDVYIANTSGEPTQGDYSLDQSTAAYAFPFTYPITFEVMVKPQFAYNVAGDQSFCRFYADTYDQAFVSFVYAAASDQLGVQVYQNLAGAGGGAITSVTALLTKVYTTNAMLQQWIRLTCVLTSTTISVYANGNGVVTSNVTMSGIRKLQLFSPGNNVDCHINYVKIYPGLTATAANIISNYDKVMNEQVWFGFQKCPIGRTRCDITSPYLQSYQIERSDGYTAATMQATLKSYSGELADDQYAAYAPESGSYNGLVTQKYLTRPMGFQFAQRSRQKPAINNTGTQRGYWSMDQTLTEWPDEASPTYLQSAWATTDSWNVSGCTVAVGGGELQVTATGAAPIILRALVCATKTLKIKVKTDAAITAITWYNGAGYVAFDASVVDGDYTIYTAYCATAHAANMYIQFTMAVGVIAYVDWIYVGTGAYATLLLDDSGMGGHGTINGCTPVAGKHGAALSFDGVNDYIATQNIRHAAALTYTAWIYPTAWATDFKMIISRNSAAWYLALYATGGVNYLAHRWTNSAGSGVTNTVAVTNLLSLNQWAHVAATFDGTYSRIYINGVLVDTGSASDIQAEGSQSTAVFNIGAYTSVLYLFSGHIDEPLIDSRAWSAAELLSYVNKTSRVTAENGFALTTDALEEPRFYGTIDRGNFSRSTAYNTTAQYSLAAEDLIKRIARRKVKSARKWEDYYLARAAPSSDSLWHAYAELATEKEVYNYLGNSGFENGTIGNSWLVTGTGGTIARDGTAELLDTYECKFDLGSGTGTVYQTVVLDTSPGDVLTFQMYIKRTAGAGNISLIITEYAAAVAGSSTTSTVAHSNGGYDLYTVTHTIVDQTTDRLRCTMSTALTALYLDAAMLTFGGIKYFYIDNANDGTAGVIDSSLSQVGTYSILGLNSEDVDYQHAYAVISDGESPWEMLKDVSDASLSRYMDIRQAGYLEMKSYFESADETTSRGTLPTAFSLNKVQQPLVANKIKVGGVLIEEQLNESTVWEAKASGVDNENASGDGFLVELADTEFYPDATAYPDGIECLYSIEAK